MTIVSRTAGAEVATAIDAHGEAIGEPRPLAGPPGTRVVVRDLFGNVPVRREYLRSPAAEFARIASWLATLALAYPHVGFTLEHDGKPTFAFAPGDDLAPRLRHVFGRVVRRRCCRCAPAERARRRAAAGSARRATSAPTAATRCCS